MSKVWWNSPAIISVFIMLGFLLQLFRRGINSTSQLQPKQGLFTSLRVNMAGKQQKQKKPKPVNLKINYIFNHQLISWTLKPSWSGVLLQDFCNGLSAQCHKESASFTKHLYTLLSASELFRIWSYATFISSSTGMNQHEKKSSRSSTESGSPVSCL